MGVWEYGSEDFVNILYHMNAFLICIFRFLQPDITIGQKKAAPRKKDRFFVIMNEKFIQLPFLF